MTKIFTFFILVLMILIFSGVVQPNGKNNILKLSKYTPIGDIWKDIPKYQNRIVTVKGQYRGWHGKNMKNPFITRSDWIIEDPTGAIYVTGRPPAVDAKNVGLGVYIAVEGRVMLTNDDVPYIKAKNFVLEKEEE